MELTQKHKTLESHKASYIRATKYFEQGEFRLAEQEIVRVIRPVLSKPMMKSLDIDLKDVLPQTLDSMYHLGLIHLHNPDGLYDNNHVKAASIFQYCAQFCKKYDISLKLDGKKGIANEEYFTDKAFEVEQQFLSGLGLANLGNVVTSVASIKERNVLLQKSKDKINSYKAELKSLRATTKEQLSYIEDLTIEDIETRSEIVEQIYEYSSEFFVNHKTQQGLLQRLIADCHQELGNPPEGCDHSIIGLGSLALGTMTPWSDLEFAVLLNEDKPEYKEYFRNLTKLLWIKVINFGETPLSAVGVESLNNYKTGDETDNWFSDNVIEKAFRFDPVYEDACKSALGRQGKYRIIEKLKDKETGIETCEVLTIEKPDYELILTSQEMLQFQLEEQNSQEEGVNKSLSWFATDRHLVQVLQSVALIEGSQRLLDQYRQDLSEKTDSTLQQDRTLQILKEDVDKFSLKIAEDEDGKLLDVKQNIYRLGDRIVNALGNYYNITAGEGESHITVWQMIDRMKDKAILNEEGAQYLKEAISIATELRMRTYSENQGRYDNMSTYIPAVDHLNEEQRKALIEKTFHIKDTSILHHFYHVMTSMQKMTNMFCKDEYLNTRTGVFTRLPDMLDPSQSTDNNYNYYKGMICARFLEYDKAFEYLEKARAEKPDDLIILGNLGALCNRTGRINQALEISKMIVDLCKIYYFNSNHSDIAYSYNNLGNAYFNKGLYNQAIDYYGKALEIWLKISNHSEIAVSHNNLGASYTNKGLYDKAIKEYKKTLKIKLKIYENVPNHPNIAISYNNLGFVCKEKGLYNQALDYYGKALEIWLKIYKNMPNHPNIAAGYNNLGEVNSQKGLYDQAMNCYENALKIKLKIYESIPNHPEIAASYNNLGTICTNKGLYDQAIDYYGKALGIWLKVYKNTQNHPNIAAICNNLGFICKEKGLYDQAIDYYDKALEIWKKVYDDSSYHSDIARSYNNLGDGYNNKGLYDQAIKAYKNAFEIWQKVYETLDHPDIATIYNNLGTVYTNKGLYDKAIEEYKKALEILLMIYENVPNHPNIASSYNNLGIVYTNKKLYDKAIAAFDNALTIYLQAYENVPNHPTIAVSYNNLGILYYKTHEYDKAIEYTEKAVSIYQQVHANNPSHPDLLRAYNNLAVACFSNKEQYYDLGCKYAALHYRNMAVFLASNGNLLEACDAFNTAYTKFLHRMTSAFYVEYAQFLISNPLIKNAVTAAPSGSSIVTDLLTRAMATIDDSVLEYGAIEKNIAPPIIQKMIEEKDGAVVKIIPKSLALYLAITTQDCATDSNLDIFRDHCLTLNDDTSFALFSEAYSFVGNVELAEKYKQDVSELNLVPITNNSTEEETASNSDPQLSGEQ